MSNNFNIQIFQELSPFFEDNYTEYGVREYARDRKISAPTASKVLKGYAKAGLLLCQEERRMLLYSANRESKVLLELSRAYWHIRIKGLTEYLEEEAYHASMTLFGSTTKLEVTSESDIDIFVDSTEIRIELERFEKILRRPIQLHFKNRLANKHLAHNIQQGMRL